ncbi:coat protein [Army ant associated cyclovirus hc]|nr:coat protein [Army ant associated cyclovirus hc]
MAFRRRVVRRRVPVYRRRGIFRRRGRPFTRRRLAFRRRRATAGNYVLRAKYSYTHTVTDKIGQSVQFKPSASNFGEFNEIYKNFEGYRFKKLSVTIRPLFNTSSPTDPAPPYVVAPYHHESTGGVTYLSAQSLNKSKVYNGCSTSHRTFVPCALGLHQFVQSGNATNWTATEARWSPRMECTGHAIEVPHFTNVVCFDRPTLPNTQQNYQYEITLSAVFIMYTQKSPSLN